MKEGPSGRNTTHLYIHQALVWAHPIVFVQCPWLQLLPGGACCWTHRLTDASVGWIELLQHASYPILLPICLIRD